MGKGTLIPSETSVTTDERTGAVIRQLTNNPTIHHHPFFMISAYDDDGTKIYFVSHRSGMPQIYAYIRASGQIRQLTERNDLDEWSIHPSHNGKYVYFNTGTGAWRVDTESLEEEKLVDFEDHSPKIPGMFAEAMGTTALSRNDRWWAIHYQQAGLSCLAIVDTHEKSYETILRRDSISHIQFCPDDDNLLFYAGPLTDRVWVIGRDGTGNRRLYDRDKIKKEWITHETWVPGTREIAFIDWPNGIRCINVDTGKQRIIATFNAWHAVCDQAGIRMIADTNFPDKGLKLFDPHTFTDDPVTVCYPEASCVGAHWNAPFPYDNGPIDVYAPQHTHPHPSFSPDGRYVVYTSDRSGFAQIYEVELPE